MKTAHELPLLENQRKFPGTASEAAFLLGGIGTGNVSVGARGELRDWELFNRPGKGNTMPYSFFAISAEEFGGKRITKVLESKIHPPYSRSHGFNSDSAAGLPRFDASTMTGEYPLVRVDLEDRDLPVDVRMEAFTPFVPLNADDSGIPGAVIRYHIHNSSNHTVEATIVGSLANAVGFSGYNNFGYMQVEAAGCNEFRQEPDCQGLYYTAPELPDHHLTKGSMALIASHQDVTVKEYWLQGGWWDGIQDFWDDLGRDGRLERTSRYDAAGSSLNPDSQRLTIGSLGQVVHLEPGEKRTVQFILTWYFPNRPKGWTSNNGTGQLEHNYYSTLFQDAWHAGTYLIRNLSRLEGQTRNFHAALFGSTLPQYVLDALASNLTVLRSPTCFRIQDGTFLGWEGTFDGEGCCEGSCTHVWNYTQSAAFLFPELERSMRRVEFNLETAADGRMAFRSRRVFGQDRWQMLPAADGQLGTIIRLYRDWKLSGSDDFLREVWDGAKRALDFAFKYWDTDGDYVLDSQQHNTYDIEFYGPNSLTNSIFFAALKAGSIMARHLGDTAGADRYLQALEQGSREMDRLLWGGEYYVQQIDDVNHYRYQYGRGCLADQLLGQSLAHTAGLGYVLPQEHVQRAVQSIYRHNFRHDFSNHHNVQRTYVLNDESGLLLCSWPQGGRPKLPFVYSDEVWTGIEYQVAAHLIHEGLTDEGLSMVKAVRDRHDGFRRNPWNEVECGHHYARSLSSWALLPALSGFEYDMVNNTLAFNPAVNADDFTAFWSTGTAWGTYSQHRNPETGQLDWNITVLYGELAAGTINGTASDGM